jgi:flagellar biosynthesis protein FliR
MSAGIDPATINVATAVAALCAGPLLASIRLLALLWFSGLMAGVTIPWRYRIAGSLLLGWTAGGPNQVSGSDLPLLAASEFVCGAALGIGVGGLLLSLKLAGELIDDRLRLTEAASEQIADDEPAGPCARLLGGLGLLLVVLGGTNGELPILEGLLGSFRSVPIGELADGWRDWRMTFQLLTSSVEIALRTALPVLAAMTIVDWCQSLVTRAASTAPAAVFATAVKPVLGLAILVATFGGACDAVLDRVRWCLTGG